MKKLYLVKTNGTQEFWTVDDENMVLRYLYSNESVDATDCDEVEDDSSWDETNLTTQELEHLFDDVEVIDSRHFGNNYSVVIEIGDTIHRIVRGVDEYSACDNYKTQDEQFFVNYENAEKFYNNINLADFWLEAGSWNYRKIGKNCVAKIDRREEFACKTIWKLDSNGDCLFGEKYEELHYND